MKTLSKLRYLTENPTQTKKAGAVLAKRILNSLPQKGKAIVLGLEGELGGGKTTFLQGFARGLGIKEKILSPTFVLMKRFKIPGGVHGLGQKNFIHIDCYRIRNPKEILNLDFRKVISDSKNIVAIEWVEKISKILPKEIIWIKFKAVNKNKRKINLYIKINLVE